MPTEDGGNLLGGESERGAQPDTQDTPVFRVAGGLSEQRSKLTLRVGRELLGWLHRDSIFLLPP